MSPRSGGKDDGRDDVAAMTAKIERAVWAGCAV